MAHLIISSKDIRTLDGLYSLNDLHKVSGEENKHRPNYFLNNQQTKELLAEIEIAEIPAIKAKQGVGTYVCKELVYAYAMWISPKFNLQVIRAFDQAQAAPNGSPDPEAQQQALTTPFVDEDKLKLLNSIAQSMGFKKNVAVVPAADMMGLIRLLREYQTRAESFAQLQTNTDWLDETIQHVKNTTGRHFGEG